MGSPSRDPRIKLPEHRSRHIRSAIVHAVSMTTIAFTHALARVANDPDAQIRAEAEIDRLQREVDLLREEARIKDARMACLPAQRRPHYPPTERLAILELRAARAWSQAETARRLLGHAADGRLLDSAARRRRARCARPGERARE